MILLINAFLVGSTRQQVKRCLATCARNHQLPVPCTIPERTPVRAGFVSSLSPQPTQQESLLVAPPQLTELVTSSSEQPELPVVNLAVSYSAIQGEQISDVLDAYCKFIVDKPGDKSLTQLWKSVRAEALEFLTSVALDHDTLLDTLALKALRTEDPQRKIVFFASVFHLDKTYFANKISHWNNEFPNNKKFLLGILKTINKADLRFIIRNMDFEISGSEELLFKIEDKKTVLETLIHKIKTLDSRADPNVRNALFHVTFAYFKQLDSLDQYSDLLSEFYKNCPVYDKNLQKLGTFIQGTSKISCEKKKGIFLSVIHGHSDKNNHEENLRRFNAIEMYTGLSTIPPQDVIDELVRFINFRSVEEEEGILHSNNQGLVNFACYKLLRTSGEFGQDAYLSLLENDAKASGNSVYFSYLLQELQLFPNFARPLVEKLFRNHEINFKNLFYDQGNMNISFSSISLAPNGGPVFSFCEEPKTIRVTDFIKLFGIDSMSKIAADKPVPLKAHNNFTSLFNLVVDSDSKYLSGFVAALESQDQSLADLIAGRLE